VNRVVDDLYTVQAGNLDSSNIARSGVNSSNYAANSVGATVLQSASVTVNKVNGEVYLTYEVFG
jgi:hypothetical protein